MRRTSLFKWFLIPAICVVMVVIFCAAEYLGNLESDAPYNLLKIIADVSLYWSFWAIVSPLLLILARRFSLDKPQVLKSLLVHVPLSLIFGILLAGFRFFLLLSMKEAFDIDSARLTRAYSEWILSIIPNIIIYWAFLIINLIVYYYERYQNQLLKASQLDAQLSDARLHALKMQLHPHFLFNTLHSITALVLKNENRDAVKMINRLSEFLRLTLETAERQAVTLEDELEFTRRYLEIELIRFQDRLTVEMDVAPQALDARVPNLILQPLVENAMRHAVDSNLGASRIEIFGQMQNGRVLLEVRDDGKDSQKISRQIGAGGLGLKNTRARLSEFYDGDYSFSLSRRESEWTVAQIVVPFFRAEESMKGEPS